MALTYLSQPWPISLAGNPFVIKAHTDLIGNVRVIAYIAGMPYSQESLIPQSGVVRFDFSEYLKGYSSISKTILSANPVIHNLASREVILIIQEELNGVMQGDPEEFHYTIFEGSIPFLIQRKWYAQNSDFNNYLSEIKGQLTSDLVSQVLPDTPSRVYFTNMKLERDVFMNVLMLFTDNTTGTIVSKLSVSEFNTHAVAEFPTGYTELALASYINSHYAGKVLKQYTCTFHYPVAGYSGIAAVYTLDLTYYTNPRVLIYRNYLNVFEHMILNGLSSQINEYKYSNANPDRGLGFPSQITYFVEPTSKIKVNSGWITTVNDLQRLSLMLESKEVYEYIQGQLVPIIFANSKLETVHDNDYQFSADIEYSYPSCELVESSIS